MYPKHFPLRRLDRDAAERDLMRPESPDGRLSRPIVYRFYDTDRKPLYIGYTTTCNVRWAAHRRHAEWWPLAEYVAVPFYRTAADAFTAEKAAIANEKPRFNQVGMQWRKQVVLRLDRPAEEIAAELHRIARPELLRELAELLATPEERFPGPTPPPPALLAEENNR